MKVIKSNKKTIVLFEHECLLPLLGEINAKLDISLLDITDFQVLPNDKYYYCEDGIIYSKNKKTLIKVPCGKTGTIRIPDGVEELATNAFGNCAVKKVIFSKNIKKVSTFAFSDCIYLEEVVLNKNLEIIEEYAFANCTRLNTMVIPNSVYEIKRYAFEKSPLVNLKFELYGRDIPLSIESFVFCGCMATSIYFPDKMTEMGCGNFVNVKSFQIDDTAPAIRQFSHLLDSLICSYSSTRQTDTHVNGAIKMLIGDNEFWFPKIMEESMKLNMLSKIKKICSKNLCFLKKKKALLRCISQKSYAFAECDSINETGIKIYINMSEKERQTQDGKDLVKYLKDNDKTTLISIISNNDIILLNEYLRLDLSTRENLSFAIKFLDDNKNDISKCTEMKAYILQTLHSSPKEQKDIFAI